MQKAEREKRARELPSLLEKLRTNNPEAYAHIVGLIKAYLPR